MPYEYLDHVADIGLRATGETFADALKDAAQGLLDLQVDTATIIARDASTISVSAPDPAALLVAFLNAIIAEQDIARRFFRSVCVDSVVEVNGGWNLNATLVGETIDLARHETATEVKAATYSGLRADLEPGRVVVGCVLDV